MLLDRTQDTHSRYRFHPEPVSGLNEPKWHMHRLTLSLLPVPIMAWRQFGARPLPEPNALSVKRLGTNFIRLWKTIQLFSFKKIHFEMPSAKWRPFCLGLRMITHYIHPLLNRRLFFFLIFSTYRHLTPLLLAHFANCLAFGVWNSLCRCKHPRQSATRTPG